MSVMTYNGGTVIAMAGADSVCIGTDLRLGVQMQTIVTSKEKVYKITDGMYVGLAGLASDAQTIIDSLRFRTSLYELRENRALKPKVLTTMISNLLYEKRFGPYFSEPIVAGLNPDSGKPEVYSMDLIGCITNPQDFVCTGNGATTLMGMCESVWEPNMDRDTLFQATAQAFLSGLERDTGSGWGAVIYTISPDKVIARSIKTRID